MAQNGFRLFVDGKWVYVTADPCGPLKLPPLSATQIATGIGIWSVFYANHMTDAMREDYEGLTALEQQRLKGYVLSLLTGRDQYCREPATTGIGDWADGAVPGITRLAVGITTWAQPILITWRRGKS